MAKKKLTIEDVLVPKEEIPYEVPENWCWVKLGSVSNVISGGTPRTTVEEYYKDGDIPWITPADLSNHNDIYISEGRRYITKLGLDSSSAKLLPKDSILLSSRAPIGYVAIADKPLATNQGFKCFEPSSVYLPKYAYWYLKSATGLIESFGSGTTFKEVSGKKAALIPMPIPPLAEQVRIVNRIESLFDKVDKASELVDEARDGFEKRRAAILERAFSGELTKKWREENGVSDEWETLKLGDIIKEGPQNGLYKPKSAYGEGHLIVRIDNFYDGSINPWNTLKRLQLTDREIDLYSLDNGDFVVNRVNSIEYLGKSALVRNLSEISVFESNVMRFKIEDGIDREYVIKYMNSPKGLRELRKNAKHAVNQASINQQDVKSADIPIPILNEQLEIVRILNRVIEEDKEFYELSNIDSSIDIIKRSILAKAFRGELGSNDLDDKSSIRLLKDLTE